jgi:DNA-binding CsgD family transcriptional regulator
MSTLGQPDLLRLRDFVREIGRIAESSEADLAAATVERLASVVPSDCVVWTSLSGHFIRATDARIKHDRDVQGSTWAKVVRLGGHPVVSQLDRGKSLVRLSDHASAREFHRTKIYDVFLRNWGVEHVLAVRVPRAYDVACYRIRRDFSDQDVLLLDLAARYLAQFVPAAPPELPLTRREAEVLRLIARGRSNGEVAAELLIAPGTVKKHLNHIFEKLEVHNRTQAAALYAREATRSGEPQANLHRRATPS